MLTTVKIKAAQAAAQRAKASGAELRGRKLFDGQRGLFAFVTPAGSAIWRIKYRFAGKEKTYTIGPFPDISIADARARADEARAQVRNGIDPSAERKAGKAIRPNTFAAVAKEWIESKERDWYPITATRIKQYLKLVPELDAMPVDLITRTQVLRVVQAIAKPDKSRGASVAAQRGRVVTAHKTLRAIGCVMRFALDQELALRTDDPTYKLGERLEKPKVQHRAAFKMRDGAEDIFARDIGRLMRALATYHGKAPTRIALQMLAHTLVRSKELRGAQWSEIDFDRATWTIPVARMKGRKKTRRERSEHVVPLSTQVIAMLKELHTLTGTRVFLFPNQRSPQRHLSENTLVGALRALGFDAGTMSAHGMRTVGATMLNAMEWRADVVEAAQAHVIPGVRGIYVRTTFFEERRQMMQSWSDRLDALRDESNVVEIGRFAERAA